MWVEPSSSDRVSLDEGLFAQLLRLIPAAPSPPREPVVQPRESIVALGDSITEAGGYLRAVDAVFAARYPHLGLPPIINAGVGGHQSGDLLARFDADVLRRRPKRVLINVGVNDVWHNIEVDEDRGILEAYRSNVARMVESAAAADIECVLLTPTIIIERPHSIGNRRLAHYAAAMRDVANRAGCGLCDLHALFLAALVANPQRRRWLTTDGVHMTPTGDALIAIGVLRSLGVPDDVIASTDPAA